MNAQDGNSPVEAPWQLGLLRTPSIGGERGEGGAAVWNAWLPGGSSAPNFLCSAASRQALCFLGDQVGLAGWTRGRDFVGCIEAWQGLT